MRKVTTSILLCLVAGLTAFSLATSIQAGPRLKDPDVPWITEDGQLIREALPECFVALDRNGNPRKDKEGTTVCIPSDVVYPDPKHPRKQDKQEGVKSRKLIDGVEVIESAPVLAP